MTAQSGTGAMGARGAAGRTVAERDGAGAELETIPGLSVDTSPEALAAAQRDKSGLVSDAPPLAVVFPEHKQAVSDVLSWAYARDIPVVTRGAGSGLSGGAVAGAGELVVNLERMNRILEISVDDRLARVEAGVINSDLDAKAREKGLWFAPDPASRRWSTIGGNISTNAGGLLCAKYGVTRESVLELTVVLGDGRIVETGHRSVKGVAGFDLVSLFVGSEGLLGIIVEATLKLLPIATEQPFTLAARFDGVAEAAQSCLGIHQAGHTPALLELIDAAALKHIHHFLGIAAPQEGEVLLIAQSDGPAAETNIHDLAAICREHGARTDVGDDRAASEELLELRRSMHPALEARGRVLIEDVSVPRSRMGEMFSQIRHLEQKWGVEIPTVAHAGDGNLHPNFILSGETVPDEIWKAADELFRAALDLGGTLTGEHGVGSLKKHWLADELGAEQWQLQKEIKRVFDPKGLLNPGKVF